MFSPIHDIESEKMSSSFKFLCTNFQEKMKMFSLK